MLWVVLAAALTGCVATGAPVDEAHRTPLAAQNAFAIEDALPPAAQPQSPRPTILALSGGGPDGAFGAGYLVGRDALGRPLEPDVVTGVSIGALIAPFVFAGETGSLTRVFRGNRLATLADDQNVLGLVVGKTLSRGDALRAIIADSLTPELVAKIAAEHAAGRRLLVATTDMERMRGTAWDIGALAAAPEADVSLMTDILLASASVPGAFPPVELPDAQGRPARHVDGGASAQFFVPRLRAGRASAVTVLVNNRIDGDPAPRTLSGVASAQRGFSTLVRAHTRSQIEALSLAARRDGTALTVITLPLDWPAAGALDFEPERIAQTFQRGLQAAAQESAGHPAATR